VGVKECKIDGENDQTLSIKLANEKVNNFRKKDDHVFIEKMEKEGIPPEIEKELQEFFRPHNRMLEELIGRKLPWKY